jgi:hypothetical protein
MEEDRHEQSEQPFDCICLLYECGCSDYDHCFLFFKENKSHGVKPFTLILCLHVADHHITKKYDHLGVKDSTGSRGPERKSAINTLFSDWSSFKSFRYFIGGIFNFGDFSSPP